MLVVEPASGSAADPSTALRLFSAASARYIRVMLGDRQALSMLTILLATCETTLDTLQAANNPVDAELTAMLRQMVGRTRNEIERLRAALAAER